MDNKQVFCVTCKHIHPTGQGYFCASKEYYRITPIRKETYYDMCEEKNINNDCKDYEMKWR